MKKAYADYYFDGMRYSMHTYTHDRILSSIRRFVEYNNECTFIGCMRWVHESEPARVLMFRTATDVPLNVYVTMHDAA